MSILNIDDLPVFTVLGLKAICSVNRDIIYGFNLLSKKDILQLLTNKLKQGYEIVIFPFIYNEPLYFKSYIK